MRNETVRVAVIGRTGKGNYGHDLDAVWLKVPNAEVVAVADEDAAGRAKAVAKLKAKAGYADYREMLAKEKPKVVSVADRWPDCHRDMVVACAEHGASIFLEKPVARTLQEADEMVAACETHHVKCAVAHQSRYSPRAKVVKELIAEGRLGEILELRGHGKEDARGGGEDLIVLGTHTFDLMRFFLGDPRWCFARVNQGGRKAVAADVRPGGKEPVGPVVGDHITATYGFAPPTVGTFMTHRAKVGSDARYWFEVKGTKGLVHLGYGAFPAAFLCEDPGWMPGRSKAPWQPITSAGVGKPEQLKAAEYGNGNVWIAQDLLKAIAEDREPVGSLKDGRAALEMVLAVYESHRQDRPVEFPLKRRTHPLAGW